MQLTDKNIYMLVRIARAKAAKLLFENEADDEQGQEDVEVG